MDMFQALGEPNRRNIVELLAAKGKLSATSISKNFKITPQAVSQHLKILRNAEVIEVEKKAQLRLYQINPKKMNELEEWIKKLTRMWDERFNRLDHILKQKEEKIRKGVKVSNG